MALQSIKGGFPFPPWPNLISAAPSANSLTINGAGHKIANIFMASAAKAIRKVHFRLGTTTTGDTVDVRIETVDTAANGDPTGTLHTVNSNASVVIAGSDDNVWKTATLTADTATLSIGEVVAIVLVNGAVPGVFGMNSFSDAGAAFPYSDQNTGTWAKDDNFVLMVPEYADGTFEPIPGFPGYGIINSRTFKSDDATNRRGNIFQTPFPARASGAWAWVDGDAAFTLKLYDSGGTELATTAATNAFQRSTANPQIYFLPFTSTVNLTASTNYRISVVPSTTSNIIMYDFDVVSAAMMDMFTGGQLMHGSVFTSSAWVETTTNRAWCGVMLDSFGDDVGGGGAGMIRHPGMSGGVLG